MTDLPAEVKFGKVTAKFLMAVTDSVDAGSMPDAEPSVGSVKFVPRVPNRRVMDPEWATVTVRPVIAELDATGTLVDAQANPELWLATGLWDVTFNIKNTRIAPLSINVTEEYTEAAPLDLSLSIPVASELGGGQYAELSQRLGDVETGKPPFEYDELVGTPDLGTAAAADVDDFATAAQGAAADAAIGYVEADNRYALIGAALTQAPGKNLFDLNAALAGQFWNGAASTPIVLAGWYASAKIPVVTGVTYTINNARNVAFFKADGSMASTRYLNNATEAPLTFTAAGVEAFIGYNVALAKGGVSQMELGSSVTVYEPYGVKVQRLLGGGRYVDDAVAEVSGASIAARNVGVTVYRAGNEMAVRSAFDTTRDIVMPVALAGQLAAGGEVQVMLSRVAQQPNIALVPLAATDLQVFPTFSASIVTTPIHGPSDDNCPVNVQWSYIGANHGYVGASSVTMTAHGKTNADRGSQWSDGTRTYTLLKVIDANTLQLGHQYSVAAGVVNGSTTVPAATLTHVAGATNTASITITGGVALMEIHPVNHSRTVSVALDGKPVRDGASIGQVLTVTETSTIVSFKALIDWSRANIGADPYANLPAMSGLGRLSNTYRFTAAQVLVAQTFTALEATVINMGVVQVIPLTLPASGLLKQFMPGVGTIGGLDFRTFAPLASMVADVNVALADQLAAGDPAQRMWQWACDSGGVPQWGLAFGVLPVMDGKPATRKANGADTRSWFISNSFKKNYPQIAWGKALAIGASLSGVGYRRYLNPAAPPEQVVTDGSRSWLTLDRTDATTSAQVARAPEVLGRRLTTVGTTTLTAGSVVTGEGVTYTNTAPGYLLAEAVVDSSV